MCAGRGDKRSGARLLKAQRSESAEESYQRGKGRRAEAEWCELRAASKPAISVSF